MQRVRSFVRTLSFKIVAIICAVLLITVILVNTYPLISTQSLIVDSIRSDMLQTANIVASSLSGLTVLDEDKINSIITILDIQESERILVTNLYGKIVFDTAQVSNRTGSYLLRPELVSALSGRDSFRSQYIRNAFESCACVPLYNTETIIGAVYLYEYDEYQGALLISMQQNIRTMTLVLLFSALLITGIFTSILSRRMKKLSNAIRDVREGNYSSRIEMHSGDELGVIAAEFNDLSGRLEHTENRRRQFVSNASHELKTPLASIKLLADSILQTPGMEMEDVREFLGDISEEISRLTRITDRLLTLTRLDVDLHSQFQPVNISYVIDRAIRMLEPLAEHAQVTLDCRTADNCISLAEEDGVYQVIFNLIENAIKYNRPQGSVRAISFVRDDKVFCIIDDTGIGVPENDLDRIFERFYRVDKARARATGGTGLGLSIVRDTIEQYGGRIWAERREPEGTRFVFTLPAVALEDFPKFNEEHTD